MGVGCSEWHVCKTGKAKSRFAASGCPGATFGCYAGKSASPSQTFRLTAWRKNVYDLALKSHGWESSCPSLLECWLSCLVRGLFSISTMDIGDPSKWNVSLLKSFCGSHGLKKSGKKEDLLTRYVFDVSVTGAILAVRRLSCLFCAPSLQLNTHSSP